MGEGRHLAARHYDGHEIRVEVGLTPIEEEDGRYVLASVVDITKRLEDEAHQPAGALRRHGDGPQTDPDAQHGYGRPV